MQYELMENVRKNFQKESRRKFIEESLTIFFVMNIDEIPARILKEFTKKTLEMLA